MTEKEIRNQMAEMLKYHRQRAKMTVYEVGQRIGKSGKTVDAWEHGRGQPDADMLLKLCSLYGVQSVGSFFGEDKLPVTDAEDLLLKLFRSLNRESQKSLLEMVAALVASGLYKKPDRNEA